MNEINTTSFRVQEYDIKKFKGFAEKNALNQAEMVIALVNAFGLTGVKGEIFNRDKEQKSKFNYELEDYENSFI